jgi:predicted small integral membrane protein
MGSIGINLSTQLYYKTLVASPKNLTISETEIGWFEIMACRAIRGEWIKSWNTSQNEGFDYSVRFQTDSMTVSCTATVASMADRKKQLCFPECIKESSRTIAIQ